MASLGGVDLDSLNLDNPRGVAKTMLAESQKAKKTLDTGVADFQQKQQEITAKRDDLTAKASEPGGALSPPELPSYKPPAPTDPWALWGSPGMWLAGLSGLMGRRSMTRSLNAAGAYLNANNQGDAVRAKQAFDQWKLETNNAVKMHDWQQESYKTALGSLKEDSSEARATVETIAHATKDDPVLQALQHGGMEAAKTLFTQREENARNMMTHQKEIVQLNGLKELQEARQSGDLAKVKAAEQNMDDINKAFGKGGASGAVPINDATIDGIYQGRIRMADLGYRGSQRAEAMRQVTEKYPDYDSKRYAIEQGVERDFKSGTTSKNITSINTAIGHMGTLLDLSDALKNGPVQRVNTLVNRIATELGKPQVNNAKLAQQAVGDEMMRTFRQVGANEVEAAQWRARFDAEALSPEQSMGAAKTAATLLESRTASLDDQWKRGMDTDESFPHMLSDRSIKTLNRVGENWDWYRPKGTGKDQPGGAKTPSPEAISHLKAHPELRKDFDDYYGPGSAKDALGE